MTFRITDLTAIINKVGGIAKPSKFHVKIYRNTGVIDRDLEFLCDSATLPGLAFQTSEFKMAGYGNTEKRPYDTILQDINTSFLCDSDGKVFNFFHRWQQSVYNFNPAAGTNRSTRGIKQNMYGYPDEYLSVIEITHYDDTGMNFITYRLFDCYPIAVGDVPVAWDMSDQLMKIPVTFTYNIWETEGLDIGIVDARLNARFQSLRYAASRIDIGLVASYGLQLLRTPNPLAIVGAVTTLANRI